MALSNVFQLFQDTVVIPYRKDKSVTDLSQT